MNLRKNFFGFAVGKFLPIFNNSFPSLDTTSKKLMSEIRYLTKKLAWLGGAIVYVSAQLQLIEIYSQCGCAIESNERGVIFDGVF